MIVTNILNLIFIPEVFIYNAQWHFRGKSILGCYLHLQALNPRINKSTGITWLDSYLRLCLGALLVIGRVKFIWMLLMLLLLVTRCFYLCPLLHDDGRHQSLGFYLSEFYVSDGNDNDDVHLSDIKSRYFLQEHIKFTYSQLIELQKYINIQK